MDTSVQVLLLSALPWLAMSLRAMAIRDPGTGTTRAEWIGLLAIGLALAIATNDGAVSTARAIATAALYVTGALAYLAAPAVVAARRRQAP